ncbi:hypothetical protein [Acidithiobacillus ferriphilus]|nr:hypothetical protein [Acidithiobacillus ferriphilus]MBU2833008.1 hypothetical protein [Acidithiobacillus ferriphilus]
MKHIIKITLILVTFAMAGCASHHHSGRVSANHYAKNGISAAFGNMPKAK